MKILYLSFAKANSSVDGVYIKGLRQNEIKVFDYSLHDISGFERYWKIFQLYQRHGREVDVVMVGYDSPQIIIALRIFIRKKIIYNALCSVYERLIVSRNLARSFSPKAIYYWFLDFLACHLSNTVMVETKHQIQYFQKLFFISKNKLFLALIGVDDEKFAYKQKEKYPVFTVLFRGRLLPEAGGEIVVEAAKVLENYPIKFLVLASGLELAKVQARIKELKPKNLLLRTEFISDNELIEIMQKSHLSLGQLADHVRLVRTIPHKAYESLALKLPYVTARNPGIMEILEEGKTCLAFKPGDASDLAKKIVWAFENYGQAQKIGGNAHVLYNKSFTSKYLAQKLIKEIET